MNQRDDQANIQITQYDEPSKHSTKISINICHVLATNFARPCCLVGILNQYGTFTSWNRPKTASHWSLKNQVSSIWKGHYFWTFLNFSVPKKIPRDTYESRNFFPELETQNIHFLKIISSLLSKGLLVLKTKTSAGKTTFSQSEISYKSERGNHLTKSFEKRHTEPKKT